MDKMRSFPLGPETALTYEERSRAEARGDIERLTRSIGELRMAVDAMKREMVNVIGRVTELERPKLTVGIQGLEGAWTVTPPPEWEE